RRSDGRKATGSEGHHAVYFHWLYCTSSRAGFRSSIRMVQSAVCRRFRGRPARRGGVLSHLPGVSRKHVYVRNDRSSRKSESYLHRAIRNRSSSDVCERFVVPHWHAAGTRLGLGTCCNRSNNSISDLATS